MRVNSHPSFMYNPQLSVRLEARTILKVTEDSKLEFDEIESKLNTLIHQVRLRYANIKLDLVVTEDHPISLPINNVETNKAKGYSISYKEEGFTRQAFITYARMMYTVIFPDCPIHLEELLNTTFLPLLEKHNLKFSGITGILNYNKVE
jgi:hypothetical protein